MKKIILVVLLVGIAGIAGVVRSHSRGNVSGWPLVINGDKQSASDVREDIRKSFQLSPGARVEVSGINGWVKIELPTPRPPRFALNAPARARKF